MDEYYYNKIELISERLKNMIKMINSIEYEILKIKDFMKDQEKKMMKKKKKNECNIM